MHESEQAEAQRMMPSAFMTESFAIGEVDESQIPEMEKAGLLIQTQPVAPPAAPPGPAPLDDHVVALRGPLLADFCCFKKS